MADERERRINNPVAIIPNETFRDKDGTVIVGAEVIAANAEDAAEAVEQYAEITGAVVLEEDPRTKPNNDRGNSTFFDSRNWNAPYEPDPIWKKRRRTDD